MVLQETRPIKINGSEGKRIYYFYRVKGVRITLKMKEEYPINDSKGKEVFYFYLLGKLWVPFFIEEVYPIKFVGLEGERINCFWQIKKIRIPLWIEIEIVVDYPLQYGQKIRKKGRFPSVKGANEFVLLILQERKNFLLKLFPKRRSKTPLDLENIKKRWALFLMELFPKK